MKSSTLFGLLAAGLAVGAPLLDDSDNECSQAWVTIWAESSSTAPIPSTLASADLNDVGKKALAPMDASTTSSSMSRAQEKGTSIHTFAFSSATATALTHAPATTTRTASDSSALFTPKRPDGSAGFPLDGDHLQAPVATDPVPDDASIFTPEGGNTFNCSAFSDWLTHQREVVKPATKWLKIKPGTYAYQPGPVMKSGTDPNTVQGENIVFWLMSGGWTFDFRDVTFYVSITPENRNQHPDVMIYINQSEDLTILGGTIWIDQGEPWTQARVTSVSVPDGGGNSKAVFQVEEGYNHTAWANAGPRNQNCVDDSNPNHFTRPGCNFWKVQDYDFSALDSDKTFSATLLGGSYLEKGYAISMQVGPNAMTTLSSEDEGGLRVKGLTSNGAFMQIGLNGKKTAVFEDVWYVNPPSRPGYAPKVQGPVLSWGNLVGYNYDEPGEAKAILQDSYWQTTGSVKDIQSADNGTLPA